LIIGPSEIGRARVALATLFKLKNGITPNIINEHNKSPKVSTDVGISFFLDSKNIIEVLSYTW
jgi:hypothetical protein